MHVYFLPFVLATSPPSPVCSVLIVRVTDARGKPIPDATVRVQAEGGKTSETVTDSRGTYRIEASGIFRLEVQRDGYRTIRSFPVALSNAATEDVYQADVSLLPGNSEEIESVELRLEEVGNEAETRDEALAREGLPKSDRLFGLRGGVNVTGIREGSGQQWLAASGSVFTSSSMSTSINGTSDFSADLGDTVAGNDSLPAGSSAFHGNLHYFHRNDA